MPESSFSNNNPETTNIYAVRREISDPLLTERDEKLYEVDEVIKVFVDIASMVTIGLVGAVMQISRR